MILITAFGCGAGGDPTEECQQALTCSAPGTVTATTNTTGTTTGIATDPATVGSTNTSTGTTTSSVTTSGNTNTATGTATSSVPSWCFYDSLSNASPQIGQPLDVMGLYNVVYNGVPWSIFIKSASETFPYVHGWGYPTNGTPYAEETLVINGEAFYDGVMANNCVYLVPTPAFTSADFDQSAPTLAAAAITISGSGTSANVEISGVNFTGNYSGGSGAWAHEIDEN
jgi:hypothetical protein